LPEEAQGMAESLPGPVGHARRVAHERVSVGAASYHRRVGFFEATIRSLNEAGVRYVIVGGLAVILHGHVRTTRDLDVVLDLEPAEARKAIETLVRAGLVPTVPVDALDFADPAKRQEWRDEKNMIVFSMRDPKDDFRRVDLFVEELIEFSELLKRSVVVPLQSTTARIASISDLIDLKTRAGRPIDVDDISALRVILEAKADG